MGGSPTASKNKTRFFDGFSISKQESRPGLRDNHFDRVRTGLMFMVEKVISARRRAVGPLISGQKRLRRPAHGEWRCARAGLICCAGSLTVQMRTDYGIINVPMGQDAVIEPAQILTVFEDIQLRAILFAS